MYVVERMNILLQFTLIILLTFAAFRVEGGCTETVQLGSRGPCVSEVQRAVGTNADGIFGQNTKNAVINFQLNRGLTADGIVGRNTWAAIYDNISNNNNNNNNNNNCGCSYDYAKGCSTGTTSGTKKLINYLQRNFGAKKAESYNCRKVTGGSNWSLHAEGRAVDYYVVGAEGTRIFNHLIQIACANGIQEVIFNKQIWTNKGGIHSYSGSNPHTDHVHVGLNHCGANSFNL